MTNEPYNFNLRKFLKVRQRKCESYRMLLTKAQLTEAFGSLVLDTVALVAVLPLWSRVSQIYSQTYHLHIGE